MDDLFSGATTHEPLAARMRPRTLDEYVGQDHIVGKGRLLRRAIAADQLSSIIFYGPPGSGKTTLARVIANTTSSNFITLNAVLTGVADIRKSIADAESKKNLYGKKTILFVDEVHRWNKSQQDALLPWVENGTIILIGATTENPFFEVNKALVSRSRVFQLKALTKEDLLKAAKQALKDSERGYGHYKVEFEDGALEHLVDTANGDARSLLNALELAVETTPQHWPCEKGSTIFISKETAEESIQKKVVLYDRDGDYHYDIISAFIKSLRGRDPDAACYWLARMVKAGEDPDFIFRRMLISACEDTGLADPYAVAVVNSCAQAFDRVGMPEGRFFLTHAALYLATAPKSNSAMAFFDALSSVEAMDADVPNHLKDASRDAEGFGHGAGYLYPHAYRDHWVAQQYLPDTLTGKVFYTPSTQGYEEKIRKDVLSRRELQIASMMETQEEDEKLNMTWWKETGHFRGFDKTEENLTFSPTNREKENRITREEAIWKNRLENSRAKTLEIIKNRLLNDAAILRHHRCLVWNADDSLLLFEINRNTPEGFTCGVCRTQKGIALLTQYSSTLQELDQCQFTMQKKDSKGETIYTTLRSFEDTIFDKIFFRDIFTTKEEIDSFMASLQKCFYGSKKEGRDVLFQEAEDQDELNKNIDPVLAKNATIHIAQRIPCLSQRMSVLLKNQILKDNVLEETEAFLEKYQKAEELFFTNSTNPLFNWDGMTIVQAAEQHNLECSIKVEIIKETRTLRETDLEKWFNPNTSAYGKYINDSMGQDGLLKIHKWFENYIKTNENKPLNWEIQNAFAIVCSK